MKIFIVHGHNNEIKYNVELVVSKLGFEPIILNSESNQSKTLIEKLEDYSEVDYAVIILSADDYGYPKTKNVKSKKLRARQNVIFEMGYFFAKLGRKNTFILKEDIENFEIQSDISGIVYNMYNEGWKYKLCDELKELGFDVSRDKL